MGGLSLYPSGDIELLLLPVCADLIYFFLGHILLPECFNRSDYGVFNRLAIYANPLAIVQAFCD